MYLANLKGKVQEQMQQGTAALVARRAYLAAIPKEIAGSYLRPNVAKGCGYEFATCQIHSSKVSNSNLKPVLYSSAKNEGIEVNTPPHRPFKRSSIFLGSPAEETFTKHKIGAQRKETLVGSLRAEFPFNDMRVFKSEKD